MRCARWGGRRARCDERREARRARLVWPGTWQRVCLVLCGSCSTKTRLASCLHSPPPPFADPSLSSRSRIMFADPPSLSTPPSPYGENDFHNHPPAPPFVPSPTPSEEDDLPLPKINFRIENGDIIYNHSPSPTPGGRRASLSRSESAPSVMDIPPSSTTISRQFTRVTSGPAQLATPAASTARLPMSTGLSSTARKVTGARRVRLDELRESVESKENNDLYPIPSSSSSVRPLADVVPVPQRTLSAQGRQVLPVPNRAGRAKRPEVITEMDECKHSASLPLDLR